MFDIRTLHRGGANYTREGRDVVYVTFAWNWWRDIHMFDSRSLIESEGEGLWRDFVNQVGGGEGGVKTEFGEVVGHPHFTKKWRTMLVEGWREGGEGRRMARVNVVGCRNFLRMVSVISRRETRRGGGGRMEGITMMILIFCFDERMSQPQGSEDSNNYE